MGLLEFLKSGLSPATNFPDILTHYQRLRPIRLRLNNLLVARLSHGALEEGAKKLGILRRGMFVFDNEDQSSVLMDYCIYDVYRKGRNAVDQYLLDRPLDADSDEMACLQAMQRAIYTMIVVLRIEPDVGCQIRDLFSGETRLLADIGFSQTAQPGLLFATRLLDFGRFVTTTGAALPVGILSSDQLDEWQRRLRAGAENGRCDPADLIRKCVERGASSRVRYADAAEQVNVQRRADVDEVDPPAATSARRRRTPEPRPTNAALENRRCRCKSGKMYKNCCGKLAREVTGEQ
jgi:hypothetical protein